MTRTSDLSNHFQKIPKKQNKNFYSIWMDGWPAMETDAGRAVMKTPATNNYKAKNEGKC